jgi:membrane protein implicated in regulation of membrane protease activity
MDFDFAFTAVCALLSALPFVTGRWRYVPRRYLAGGAAYNGGMVAGMMLSRTPTYQLVMFGTVAALYAWAWWKRRPPRKRRESKSLARIRDLGHRLVTE